MNGLSPRHATRGCVSGLILLQSKTEKQPPRIYSTSLTDYICCRFVAWLSRQVVVVAVEIGLTA